MSDSKSRLRRDVEQMPPAETRFYRKNDEVVARIHELMDERDLTQKELAEEVGKTPSYVSRVLGGGVNLTLETIAEFEEALSADILSLPASSSVQSAAKRRRYEVESQYTEAPAPAKSGVSREQPSEKRGFIVIEKSSTVGNRLWQFMAFETGSGQRAAAYFEEAEGIG